MSVQTDGQMLPTRGDEAGRARRVRVLAVVDETAQAKSFLVEPDSADESEFDYSAGQFLTVRVPDVGTGSARCYSLASSPLVDDVMKFTVKRVADGHGSNWLCDTVAAGDTIDVLPPGGTFGPRTLTEDLVLVAGGSGITPVLSIAKSVLFAGDARVLLVYANRDETSVIFADELRSLAASFGDRFTVVHVLESVQGFPDAAILGTLLRPLSERALYVCGPAPLMDLTAGVATAVGFAHDRVHSERFVSLTGDPFAEVPVEEPVTAEESVCTVDVELDGERREVPWAARQKLLDALLAAGLDAPYSCREGACSACVCTLRSGEVRMAHNEILADEDIADGYILACQAEPVSDRIEIEY